MASLERMVEYRKEWLESGISDERIAATEAVFLDELVKREPEKVEKAKRMLDRLIDRIEEMELDCDEGVYDALLKIQYAMA